MFIACPKFITVPHNGNPIIHNSYIERIHKKLELRFQSKSVNMTKRARSATFASK